MQTTELSDYNDVLTICILISGIPVTAMSCSLLDPTLLSVLGPARFLPEKRTVDY